ncbi:4884_t:CDS:2, partial [Cetraspora pellucida]
MYLDETKRSSNFQIVESSEDMMDIKSEPANKLDIVLEISEVPSQRNDKYKVKFDKLKNLDDNNYQNSEKEDSKKSNNKEKDANIIENDYEEEVNEMYKENMNYEAEEEVDEIYRADIEETDQIDRAEFDRIENEEISIIEKRRKKKMKEFNLNIVNCSLALSAVAYRFNLKKIKVFTEKKKAVLKNENRQITLEPANYK